MVGEQQILILLVDLIQPRKKLKSRHFGVSNRQSRKLSAKVRIAEIGEILRSRAKSIATA